MTERRRFEAAVALSLTVAAIWLNYQSVKSAGGLWRDEANTVALATLPHWTDVWKNLQFDSFPIVWIALVRVFAAVVGTGNDSAFRTLGCVIGLSLIATLWVNARNFGYRFPVVALSLIAVAPSVVRWGDSMRAYGLGMVLIVLTITAVRRYVRASSTRNLLAAGVMALLSVHTIYYNSVLLFAICAGATAVCIRRRQSTVAARIVGMGLFSAVSLTPYFSIIRGASKWNSLVRIQAFTAEWFSLKLYDTLAPAGSFVFVVWITIFLFCLATGTLATTTRIFRLTSDQKDNVVFATVMLVAGTIGSFLFLRALSYSTQPWYYLTLVIITGVSMDIILGTLAVDHRSRTLLGFSTLALGIATAVVGSDYLGTRLTNADLVASRLKSISGPRDMIIVNPWYDGVSFNRYYRGAAVWKTVPPIPFHAFHRYDMVMRIASLPSGAAISPLLEGAKHTLMSGSTVFIVGTFPKLTPENQPAQPFQYAAADDLLQTQWAGELAELIRAHAMTKTLVSVNSTRPISRYESMTVTAISGWR